MKLKLDKQKLAAAGITGGLAVLLFLAVALITVGISLGIFALVGALVAYLWNTMVVPNVDAHLPTVLWWQAAALLLGIRIVFGLIIPVNINK